jgi:beta-glucosidase
LPGIDTPWGTPTTIEYTEGPEVGYRRFAKTGDKPLYAFGYGLTYTSFAYRDFQATGGGTVTAQLTVTNTGPRRGADVPQVYLTEAAGERRMRLLGFERVELDPGESRTISVTADRRLLARFNAESGQWHIVGGTYRIALCRSAGDPVATSEVTLSEQAFGS